MTKVSDDFPPKPSPEELTAAVKTVLTAMFHIWSIEPEGDNNSATRQQAADLLGFEEGQSVMEVLGCFDHWSNDIMCMAPDFGLAYKPAEWDHNGATSFMKSPPKLFVPPPKPEGNFYWSLDDAEWTEFTPDPVEEVEVEVDG